MGPTKYFMEIDRERAKIGLNPEQLAYVEALERIAKDAYQLWKFAPVDATADRNRLISAKCDLYDALSVVDFMQSEDE